VGKFLLVIILFAGVVYAAFWLLERRRAGVRRTRPRPASPQPRTVAPDDDEDFLRELNRRRRRGNPGAPKDKGPDDTTKPSDGAQPPT